jgi:hypothetical protein
MKNAIKGGKRLSILMGISSSPQFQRVEGTIPSQKMI